MAQHDFDIANADGATVRADLNALFEAIASKNSGSTTPSVTFPFMWWADTNTGILKLRNSANTDWITIGTLASAGLGLASLDANTFTGVQNFADNTAQRARLLDYAETVNAIGSIGGGTQDIDLESGNVVSATVDTSETTFTFSNAPSSGSPSSGVAGSFTLILTNGGSETVNWPASVQWAGGTAPSLTASGVDILTFVTVDGGSTWYGFAAGLDMS
jgi:hypothetical protein